MFNGQCLAIYEKHQSYRAHQVQFAALYLFGVSTLGAPTRAKGEKAGIPVKSHYNVGVREFFEFVTV